MNHVAAVQVKNINTVVVLYKKETINTISKNIDPAK